MSFPKLGMHYEDVRRRVKRIKHDEEAGKAKNRRLAKRLKASLLNQCRLHEGNGAVNEIERELNFTKAFSGAGNRSCGFGDGVKGSSGKYVWDSEKGEWVKQ